MTISDIVRTVRDHNDDLGATQKKTDTYYTEKIIGAFGDLEAMLGKIAMRVSKFQFVPVRDVDKSVKLDDDGVPEIDSDIYYNPLNPEDYDTHIPSHANVNKGLSVVAGQSSASLESAEFLDELGVEIIEEDVAFVKIDLIASDDAVYTVDISLDDRESWAVADYGKTLSFENGSTGFVDVSDIPSSRVAIKWTVTAGTIKSCVLERYYVPENTIRHYRHALAELAYARILDIQYKNAIEHQNDPITINGIKSEIDGIRKRYSSLKGGNQKETAGKSHAISYYPHSREEDAIFGTADKDGEFLTDKRVVGLTSTGEIRRV
jgi:hypothetical protein